MCQKCYVSFGDNMQCIKFTSFDDLQVQISKTFGIPKQHQIILDEKERKLSREDFTTGIGNLDLLTVKRAVEKTGVCCFSLKPFFAI